MARASLVEGDTETALRVTLRYRGTSTPVPLAGATVTLRFRVDEGSPLERLMTILDADGGVVRYAFQSGELTPGTLSYEVLVISSDGGRLTTTDLKTLVVRARL